MDCGCMGGVNGEVSLEPSFLALQQSMSQLVTLCVYCNVHMLITSNNQNKSSGNTVATQVIFCVCQFNQV